tara:strand:- start:807 stop:1226 length:420 start_codon:yes stop_codon:yes gene_type:complete
MTRLERMLIRHEGLRLKPYKDTRGKLTIGVGRNLTDVGISRSEAIELLHHDLGAIYITIFNSGKTAWVQHLDVVRVDVVTSMIFNMGLRKFLTFRKAIQAMKAGDWGEAAREMLDSQWAGQVGGRARTLAAMMREGKYK